MSARLAAMAALLALAAGCGGDDEPDADRGQAPAQTTSTAAEDPAPRTDTAPQPAAGVDVALSECLSSAGFQDVSSAEAGLIRASDPETGAEVRVQLFGSPAQAEKFAGSQAGDTAVVGSSVAIYPDQLDEGAKTAAEGCMGGGPGDPGAESPAEGEAPAESRSCDDVPITPNSGDGLFEVTVSGASCEKASSVLGDWGRAGYPDPGPPGLTCTTIERYPEGNVRLRCTGQAQTIEFDTGI